MLRASNNAATTLAQAIDGTVNSFMVADASLFPDAPFRVTIDNEIMEVGTITKATNTFSNVTRGVENTIATSHNAGAAVENRWTAGMYSEITTDFATHKHTGNAGDAPKIPMTSIDTAVATQAAFDTHVASTTAHGSTSAATAGAIMQRDASGRAKVAPPAAADDIARKDTIDVHVNNTSNPHNVTAAQIGYTASDVLAKIKTVDGAGSGVDADLLDGQHGSYYLPASSYTAADVLAKIKTVDGAGSGLDADTIRGSDGLTIFGDGSDGNVTITANTTLSRDMYYNNLTINSGVTLYPNGYRIFVANTLINNGTISVVGSNGADATRYAGGTGGAGITSGFLHSGAGGATRNSGVSTSYSLGASGGAGGNGYTTNPNIQNLGNGGGGGGTANIANSAWRRLFNLLPLTSVGSYNEGALTLNLLNGGAGGGGGGYSFYSNSSTYGLRGGGGGGGGGVVFIFARTITNNGVITARGGNGGAGITDVLDSYNHYSGGGGGGGGGAVVLVYRTKTAAGTIIVSGGSGGASGGGSAQAGAAGSNGSIYEIIV